MGRRILRLHSLAGGSGEGLSRRRTYAGFTGALPQRTAQVYAWLMRRRTPIAVLPFRLVPAQGAKARLTRAPRVPSSGALRSRPSIFYAGGTFRLRAEHSRPIAH
jgi:hypothetical protein